MNEYWQWRLFVIDGVISIPVALSGFFVLPDVPEISSPWYLSDEVCSTLFIYMLGLRPYWPKIGGPTRAETNAARRTTESRPIHQVQAQEDLFFMADLSLDDFVYVGRSSPISFCRVLTCLLEHSTMGLQVVSRFSNSKPLFLFFLKK